MSRYLGIDQSLSNTGIIVLNEKSEIVYRESIKTEPKMFKFEIERLVSIRDRIKEIVRDYQVDYAALEGFGYGARGNAVFQIAGLGYLIREIFWNQKISLEIIPPKSLKKWVTGNGNAQKNLMLLETYKRWGEEFKDDNICDAYGLARFILEKHK